MIAVIRYCRGMLICRSLVLGALSASLLGGLGCDSGSSAELEAARADLATAKVDLENARADLGEATAELKAARAALEEAARVSAAAIEAKTSQPPDDPLGEAAAAAIRCGAEKCTVDRDFVRKALAEPSLLARQARVVPAIKDGVSSGFKLYGIRRTSLPKLFGMKNGDLVTAVNGSPIRSLDQAMAAYEAHKGADTFVIDLVRKDKPIALTIELVDGGDTPPEKL